MNKSIFPEADFSVGSDRRERSGITALPPVFISLLPLLLFYRIAEYLHAGFNSQLAAV